MKKQILAVKLIFILLCSLIVAACPKDSKTALESGFASTVRISSYGTDLTNALTRLHGQGAITTEKFNSAIDQLERVSRGGRAVHTTLARFVERYPDGNVPASEWNAVSLAFNSDVYSPALALLAELALIPDNYRVIIEIAMAGLRTAVMNIKRLMNKHSATMAKAPEVSYV